ncbi:MAG: lipoate--protein ligase family protein [Caldilineales bacterium]|nr:lipoate--protein ligase family protein [Caldilineales bacterium]MCW5856786.1 lipoate--protein ligase family protein [Caldilineales bacterium]
MSRTIRLLDLGEVAPLRSQTVYHTAAYALTEDSPDTIILVSPQTPYVCIGYHQDLEKEVDLAYCREHGLPVYRREVGGGAVYLDRGQIFTQWAFHRDRLPAALEARFDLYIRPLVETYRALGIEAYHRPINDIHVAGKKIGGTGAAQMGVAEVVVGSLMLTFDKATMAKVLKVPSEKMRDKIFESLEQYMTTIQEQLGQLPPRQEVKDLYVQKCRQILGVEIVPGAWTEEEESLAAELDARFASEEWLFQQGRLRQPGVKIHSDVQVVEKAFKAPGGLIRVVARLREGRIDDLSLSGDFTLLPSFALGALEQAVRGLSARRDSLTARLQEAYQRLGIQSPGVTPADFATAILAAADAQG